MQSRRPRFQQASEMMSAVEPGGALGGAPALGAFRVGAELRAARLRLGWGLPEIADALRIRLLYLEGIEAGRLADLPGNAYALGYLRIYAKALGLDPGEVARRFRAEAQEVDRRPDLTFPAPAPQRGAPTGAVVLLGALITAISYAAWFGYYDVPGAQQRETPPVPARFAEPPRPSSPSGPAPDSLASQSAPDQAALPAAMPSGPAEAEVVSDAADASPPGGQTLLRFTAASWVQVRQKQGPVLVSRVMRPGETWPVPPDGPLLLTTGNAGGTEIVVDGVAQPPLGPPGAVKRDIPIGAASPSQ